MSEEKISEAEMAEALQRSGYLIESRLLNILSDWDYYTYPNETYPDPITQKSREIDIFASSYRTTESLKLNDFLMIDITHDLIVECANNPQPAVFFRRTEKKKLTIFNRYRYRKVEQEILEDINGADHYFLTHTVGSKEFHYNQIERSSQYCSFSPKKSTGANQKKEWLASHPDLLHDTFNKMYDFIESRQPNSTEWMKTHRKYDVHVSMVYPVLVLQGDILEAFEDKGKIKLIKTDHTIFEFNRYSDTYSSLLVDVVSESYFEKYLQTLRDDMEALRKVYVEYYSGKTLKNTRPKPDLGKRFN